MRIIAEKDSEAALAWILQQILMERRQQDAKWGVRNHAPERWLAILTEEVGELAGAVLNPAQRPGICRTNIRDEALQIAAVAVAILEWHDRNSKAEGLDQVFGPLDLRP